MNILIVEDEVHLQKLLSIHLRNEGYTVLEASNGKEALQIFNSSSIHLIIQDIMMPIMNGIDLIQEIRLTSTVPIICLTALGTDTDKILALGLGSDDYLVKPVNVIELLARVKSHLRRCYKYTSNSSIEIINGNLKINLSTFEVFKGNKPINLNPKEFKILNLLMNNIGRVYTKKQIYELVWDDYYIGDDNTLLVTLSHLREKIEDNPKTPIYLKTIRGIGYKIERITDNVI